MPKHVLLFITLFATLVTVCHPERLFAQSNLVVNGNFNAGNTGFATQYNYAPSGGTAALAAGTYNVGTNPALWAYDFTVVNSYGDHTTGSGLMLMCNGATSANTLAWGETASVTPNTNYNFSAWVSSVDYYLPATLSFVFNGGTPISYGAPSTGGVWQQLSTTVNSGNNTSLAMQIFDTNLQGPGNDFALDDISLTLQVPAASYTWDASGNGSAKDGAGTWSISNANWSSGTADQVWNNATGDTAVFGTGSGASNPYTVTLAGSISVGGVIFQNQTYTLAGGTLNMIGPAPTITVNAGSASIGAVINGTIGLTKTGTGVLNLTAANTYTGATAINGGLVALLNANALPSTGNISFGGGTLQYSASNSADYSSRIVSSAGPISIDVNGQSVGFSGNLASSNTAGLTLTSSVPGTAGAGDIPASTLALRGNNSYTGGTTVTGSATLSIIADGSLGPVPGSPSPNVFLNGGELKNYEFNALSLNANRTIVLGAAGGNLDIGWNQVGSVNGQISGSGALGVAWDTGTLVLAGSDTYLGSTTIGAGNMYYYNSTIANAVLQLGNSAALPPTTRVVFGSNANNNSATLDMHGFSAAVAAIGGGTDAAVNNAGGGTSTLTVGNNGGSGAFSGTIENTSGTTALTKIGSGTQTLSGSNTYTGPTTINGGELLVNGTLASPVTVNSGGVLGGTGSLTSATINSGGTLSPGDAPGALNFTGSLTLLHGAVMDYELGTPSNSDEVLMPTGLLALNDQNFGDFDFTPLSGFGPGEYTLIDAGSISGSLGSGTSGVIGGFQANIAVQGDSLVLTVVPEPGTLALLGVAVTAFVSMLVPKLKRRFSPRCLGPESQSPLSATELALRRLGNKPEGMAF